MDDLQLESRLVSHFTHLPLMLDWQGEESSLPVTKRPRRVSPPRRSSGGSSDSEPYCDSVFPLSEDLR